MAGLVPAIRRATVPPRMAGTSPAMTGKSVALSCEERSDEAISVTVANWPEIASSLRSSQ
jgi:hypothetical protein